MDRITVSTRNGDLNVLAGADLISKALCEYGEWAQNEINLLAHFIRRGDAVVDAGSFLGSHARAFSNLVGKPGVVYAFEPNPGILELLNLNVQGAENENIQLNTVALGSHKSEAFIRSTDKQNMGGSELTLNKEPTAVSVQVAALDDFDLPRADFIKADVEGFELALLQGASRTINKYRPVIFLELLSLNSAPALLAWSRRRKYAARGVVTNAFNAANFRRETRNSFGDAKECGVLLIPTERAANYAVIVQRLQLPQLRVMDDVALLLLHKPQFVIDQLSKTSTNASLGLNFPSPGLLDARKRHERERTEWLESKQVLSETIAEMDAKLAEMRLGQAEIRAATSEREGHLANQLEIEQQNHAASVLSHARKERDLFEQLASSRANLVQVEQSAGLRERGLVSDNDRLKSEVTSLKLELMESTNAKLTQELHGAKVLHEAIQKSAEIQEEWIKTQSLLRYEQQQLRAELSEEQIKNANLSAGAIEARVELEQVLAAREALHLANADLNTNLRRIQSSLSWRVMTPFRKLRHLASPPAALREAPNQVDSRGSK